MFSLCTGRSGIPLMNDITIQSLANEKIESGFIKQNQISTENLLLWTHNNSEKPKFRLKSTNKAGIMQIKPFNKPSLWKRMLNPNIYARYNSEAIAYSEWKLSVQQCEGSQTGSVKQTPGPERQVILNSGDHDKQDSLFASIASTSAFQNTPPDSVELKSPSELALEEFNFLPSDVSASTTPASSPNGDSPLSWPDQLKSIQPVLRYLMEYVDISELQNLIYGLENQHITPYRFLATLTGTFAHNARDLKGDTWLNPLDTYLQLSSQLRTIDNVDFVRSAQEAFKESAAHREMDNTRL